MNYHLHSKRLVFGAAAILCTSLASAAHAATMDVLLNGHDLRMEYAGGAVVSVSFNADGTYETSTGSSGTWTLDGENLCTVRSSDGASGCGVLPNDKTASDTWETTDANGAAITVSIVERQA